MQSQGFRKLNIHHKMRVLHSRRTFMLRFLLVIPCALLFIGAEPPVKPSDIPKPKLNNEALDKLGWRLGSQAYTWRSLSLFETLDVLNALGIKYVELYPGQHVSPQHDQMKFNHDSPAEVIDQVMAKCKSAGVTPVNYGVVNLPNDEAQQRKVFEFARKLGLETIVSEPPADAFDIIDKLANEYQIKVAIHDHPKPSHYWNPEAVLKACEGRSKMIGACADIGHWWRSGLVPVDCLKKLEGRIISFHFKDITEVEPGKKEDVPWGTGKSDIAGVMAEMKRQGLANKPLIAIEYETGSGPELIANVSKSIEYFSDVATELAK
jgi:sugar phosphate isomerase/epimerase